MSVPHIPSNLPSSVECLVRATRLHHETQFIQKGARKRMKRHTISSSEFIASPFVDFFVSSVCFFSKVLGVMMKHVFAFNSTTRFALSFHSAAEACVATGSACFVSVACFFSNVLGALPKSVLAIYNSNALALSLNFAADACRAIGTTCYLVMGMTANVINVSTRMTLTAAVAIATHVQIAYTQLSLPSTSCSFTWLST
jgi:hypothetical protein